MLRTCFVFGFTLAAIAVTACGGDDGPAVDAAVDAAADAAIDAGTLPVGATCTTDFQCSTGFCVDGVCCATACDTSGCMGCAAAVTGSVDGTCAPVRAGTDPHDECGDAPGSCSTGQCDGNGACVPVADGTVCRAAAGPCDLSESCVAGSCPPDALVPQSAQARCRDSAGTCDTAEQCDGVSPQCPVDALVAAGVVCRDAVGGCDLAETCSGTGPQCPADALAATGATCRPSAGGCDPAETCTGGSAQCPADALTAAGTTCRAAAGDCDLADTCTGTSPQCDDRLVTAGTVCRPATGPCDRSETCTGTAPVCPTDALEPAGMACRASAGACDPAETCSGASAACPADTLAAAGTVCRPAVSVCDQPETCIGTTPSCPFDSVSPIGTLCRPAVGPCDQIEYCTGATQCPTDALLPPNTAQAQCDPYTCNGTGIACPTTCTTNLDCAGYKTACVGGACVPAKLVFLTHTTYSSASSLNGVAGADAACQARADLRGYGGTFRAWLSSSSSSVASRFTPWNGPYLLPYSKTKVADSWADLIDGSLDAPINRTDANVEFTNPTTAPLIWTGTAANGTFLGRSCLDWTGGLNQWGRIGNLLATDGTWSNWYEALCTGANGARLYCFEQ